MSSFRAIVRTIFSISRTTASRNIATWHRTPVRKPGSRSLRLTAAGCSRPGRRRTAAPGHRPFAAIEERHADAFRSLPSNTMREGTVARVKERNMQMIFGGCL
ncbi:hypothetical protein Sfum_0394 [Syntrophobacter fumaroxidans MPOB]|uniref:Uncharacterized protein n=1 Tax=Syntrophobacter fumaroxidans (strain DSM 10017 / MPOB) TaxID=335543 RepID=A0LF92_SYNFM|nr:hypothetical protein Sfum_0394 [Syntrophobacter fumaroxidans MPOB]